jgi:hypothetical protein
VSGVALPRSATLPPRPRTATALPRAPRPAWHAWENLSDAVGVTSMLLGLALCALAIVGG